MRIAAALLIVLTACTVKPTPREGAIIKQSMPQAAEQCRAQPYLDWCREP